MQTCHHLISSILITTVLLIGCTQSKDAEQSAAEMPPVVVSTITVLPQSMNVIENLPGRVTAYRIAEIRPQVGGIVDKVLFKQGSYVQAGQPLFKLNSEIFQADVKQGLVIVLKLNVLVKSYFSHLKREYNLLTFKTSQCIGN